MNETPAMFRECPPITDITDSQSTSAPTMFFNNLQFVTRHTCDSKHNSSGSYHLKQEICCSPLFEVKLDTGSCQLPIHRRSASTKFFRSFGKTSLIGSSVHYCSNYSYRLIKKIPMIIAPMSR